MVTREEVAKRAGVSVGTVSNVMNNKTFVKTDLVEKVKRAIDELNYVPDFNAKSLAKRKTNHIGVAVYEMTNPYHAEIIQGIEEYAADLGYIVSIFLLDNKRQKKLDAICERRLDGLINFMTNDLPREFVEILKRQNTVLVNFTPEDSFVIVNDYANAMHDCMLKVQELGHRKVAYLCTYDKLRFPVEARGRTFLREREACGFDPDDSLIYYNDDYEKPSEQIGYQQAGELFSTRQDVTAIFATNDLSAMGIIKRLSEMGFRCPEDVSVIGCDGLTLGKFFVPAITTISCDKRQYGADIAKAMIEHIEDPERHPYKTIVMKTGALFRDSISTAKK